MVPCLTISSEPKDVRKKSLFCPSGLQLLPALKGSSRGCLEIVHARSVIDRADIYKQGPSDSASQPLQGHKDDDLMDIRMAYRMTRKS